MLVYRCDQGHTLVDNAPDWLFAEPQIEEIFDFDPQEITTEMTLSWSGSPNDWFLDDNNLPVR